MSKVTMVSLQGTGKTDHCLNRGHNWSAAGKLQSPGVCQQRREGGREGEGGPPARPLFPDSHFPHSNLLFSTSCLLSFLPGLQEKCSKPFLSTNLHRVKTLSLDLTCLPSPCFLDSPSPPSPWLLPGPAPAVSS